MVEWCKENGNPTPLWQVREQSVITTFLPSIFFSTGKTFQEHALESKNSRPESRPESLTEEVLNLLQKGPLSKSELSNRLGHKQISSGLKKILHYLLEEGKITFTIPQKPNSRLQKYQLKN